MAQEYLDSPLPRSKIPDQDRWTGRKENPAHSRQYADESNLTGDIKDILSKLDALAGHCERLGRDHCEITVTKLIMTAVAPTMEQAEADLKEMAATKGWNDSVMDMVRKLLIFGDPDTVGEQIAEAVSYGIDGVALDLPVNGHKTERIELLGEIALKALG